MELDWWSDFWCRYRRDVLFDHGPSDSYRDDHDIARGIQRLALYHYNPIKWRSESIYLVTNSRDVAIRPEF